MSSMSQKLRRARAANDELRLQVSDLRFRVQHLIDAAEREEGCYTFPDGETWWQTGRPTEEEREAALMEERLMEEAWEAAVVSRLTREALRDLDATAS